MLDKLTSKQISEWQAYDKLDPIGDWRKDYHMAFLSAVITNISSSIYGKKGTKPVSPIDFMPNWGEDQGEIAEGKKEQSLEEMKKILQSIAQAHKTTQPNKKVRKPAPVLKPKSKPIRKRK